LHARKLEVTADGRASQAGSISIGRVDIPYGDDPKDHAKARVEWPTIAPYFGIGWGHHVRQDAGFGFIADLGVSFGSPKTYLTISDPLREKLNAITGLPDSTTTADAEIERQRRDIADDVEEIKVFPHVFVGVSYRF